MSKKARRRPTWKKYNFYLPKGYKWSTDNGFLMVWPKSVEREFEDVLRKNFLKEMEHEQDRIS